MGYRTKTGNSGGGGGGTGFTDSFSIGIKAADSNAAPTDNKSFQIALTQSDTNATQTETVKLGFPAGVFGDSSAAPTDGNSFALKVWLSGSAGSGVTNPSNANGQNDGAIATLQTVALGTNPIIMTSALGANVPTCTITSLIYRGWFKSVSPVITGEGKITIKSTGALFSDIVMFTNSGLGVTVDHLTGTFTYDLYAAGVNTLAKAQSMTVEHRTTDLVAGVTPHVLTVDAGCVEIAGAFT